MATAVQIQNPPAVLTKPKVRRLRQFDGSDRWVVLAMAGIPTILHVGLIWIPTIASILLSFTDWKGIRLSDINWVGSKNYVEIFTVFEKNFFQALINNSVLLVFLFPYDFFFPAGHGIVKASEGQNIISKRLFVAR